MIGYTGNSACCFANSLHMCLRAGGYGAGLPEAGFVECLTTTPFGTVHLRTAAGPLVFFGGVDPEVGLERALAALGWACDGSHGCDGAAALGRLERALASGPALLGPLDMGLLPCNTSTARGADHYVVAVALEGDRVLLHDPGGFPCSVATRAELLETWRGDGIAYRRGPYGLRARFRAEAPVDRAEAVRRTVPLARANLLPGPDDPPTIARGAAALRLLAADLRGEVPATLPGHLTRFALPLGARRGLDGAAFLREAGLDEAGACMERRARLLGEAQWSAMRADWPDVAELMEWLARAEDELVEALAGA